MELCNTAECCLKCKSYFVALPYSERVDADESLQDGLHLVFGNSNGTPTLLCCGVADGRRFNMDKGVVTERMPIEDELIPSKNWVENQIEQKVITLKKPVLWGRRI
jgi:hypothetical protein